MTSETKKMEKGKFGRKTNNGVGGGVAEGGVGGCGEGGKSKWNMPD